MIDNIESWGRYPRGIHKEMINVFWRDELHDFSRINGSVLPIGLLKSYGDSCLNFDNTLLNMSGYHRLIDFNDEEGIITCEAGTTLSEILNFAVPRGWFLASTPGTKQITVGGAIANDVHGKNHHKGGTFGCHVLEFELVRTDGKSIICSQTQNSELFAATIGGLGLTGIITWARLKLQRCPSPFIVMESIKFDCIEEFFEINAESESRYDYTVSWIDTTASGANLGRGIYNRGNHANPEDFDLPKEVKDKPPLPFPLDYPFINNFSVNAFNVFYYNKQTHKKQKQVVHYNPFFYPLDAVNNWNRAYGKNGFLQYQFVVPFGKDLSTIKQIMTIISNSGLSSFLTVLKTFGNVKSPGIMSFPREGITMAVDFRISSRTLEVLKECDKLVRNAGGVLYPAKDARMSREDFQTFYPQWIELAKYKDPKISSSFWRRVVGE